MHKRIMAMKEQLATAIESQLCNLQDCDCEELGEAVDMLKDLEEALYFCTITEAMNKGSEYKKNDYYPSYSGNSQMYYGGWSTPSNGNGTYHTNDHNGHDNGSSMDYYQDEMMRDAREGRSPQNRRMYMEAKHTKDKATQLRELEKYMQELTSDMVEMIQDASPEEKQYLEKKITALGAKIGQMK